LFSTSIFYLLSCAETNLVSQQLQQATPTPSYQALLQDFPPQLFIDVTEPADDLQNAPLEVRSRFVHINTNLLLSANGQILELEPGTLLTINLFPDVYYIGVIKRIEQNGPNSHSWIGYLKDVEYSSMYIVFTEGVFLAHFASPAGVYEVHLIENNLYQVVEIDQTKAPKD
jgi:hypothetical protein